MRIMTMHRRKTRIAPNHTSFLGIRYVAMVKSRKRLSPLEDGARGDRFTVPRGFFHGRSNSASSIPRSDLTQEPLVLFDALVVEFEGTSRRLRYGVMTCARRFFPFPLHRTWM